MIHTIFIKFRQHLYKNSSVFTRKISLSFSEVRQNKMIFIKMKQMEPSFQNILKYIQLTQEQFYPAVYSQASKLLADQLHHYNWKLIKKEEYKVMRQFYQKLKGLKYDSFTLFQLFNFCKIIEEFKKIDMIDKQFPQLESQVADSMMSHFKKEGQAYNLDVLTMLYKNYTIFQNRPAQTYEAIAKSIYLALQKKEYQQTMSLKNVLQIFYGVQCRQVLTVNQRKMIMLLLELIAKNIKMLTDIDLVKLVIQYLRMNLMQKFKMAYHKNQNIIIAALQKIIHQIPLKDCYRFLNIDNNTDQANVFSFFTFTKVMNLIDEFGFVTDQSISNFQMLDYIRMASQKHKLRHYKQNKFKFFDFLKRTIIQSRNSSEDSIKTKWKLSEILSNEFFSPQYIPFLEDVARMINLKDDETKNHIYLLHSFASNNIRVPEEWFQVDLSQVNIFYCSLYAISINQQKRKDPSSNIYDEKLAELDRRYEKIYLSKDLFCTMVQDISDEYIMTKIHKLYGSKYVQAILKLDDEEISLKNIKKFQYYYILRFIGPALSGLQDQVKSLYKIQAMKIHIRKLSKLKLSDNVLLMLVFSLPHQIVTKNKQFLYTAFQVLSFYTEVMQTNFYLHSKAYHYYTYWEVVELLISKIQEIKNMGLEYHFSNFLLQIIYLIKQNNFSNEIQYRKFISNTLLILKEFKTAYELSEFIFKEALRLNLLHRGLQKTVWPYLKSVLFVQQSYITEARIAIQNYVIPQNYQIKSHLTLPAILLRSPQKYLQKHCKKIISMINIVNYKILCKLIICFDLDLSQESKQIFHVLANRLNEFIYKLEGVDILGIAYSLVRNAKRFQAEVVCKSIGAKICQFLSRHLHILAPQSHANLIEELTKIKFYDRNYMKKYLNWICNDEKLKVKILEDIMSSLINADLNFQENDVALYFQKVKVSAKANSLIHFLFLEKYIKKEARPKILENYMNKAIYLNIFYWNYLHRHYPTTIQKFNLKNFLVKYPMIYKYAFQSALAFLIKLQRNFSIKFVKQTFYESNYYYKYKNVYLFFLPEFYAQSQLKVDLFLNILAQELKVPNSKIIHLSIYPFDEAQAFKLIIKKLQNPISKQAQKMFLESINKKQFHNEQIKKAQNHRVRIGSIPKSQQLS